MRKLKGKTGVVVKDTDEAVNLLFKNDKCFGETINKLIAEVNKINRFRTFEIAAGMYMIYKIYKLETKVEELEKKEY